MTILICFNVAGEFLDINEVRRWNGYNQHPCQSALQIHRNQDGSPWTQHADTERLVRGKREVKFECNMLEVNRLYKG